MSKFDTFIQTKILRMIRLNMVLKIIKKLEGRTILDLGCMDDYLLKRLPERFNYFGVDENPLCESNVIMKCRIEEFSTPYKFDIVICLETLEHLKNPVLALEKMKKYSKKYIIISVPNEPFFALFRGFIPAKEHLWTIFPQTLRKYLGQPTYETLTCFNRTYIGVWRLR